VGFSRKLLFNVVHLLLLLLSLSLPRRQQIVARQRRNPGQKLRERTPNNIDGRKASI
jgi:hypothetical protein